MKTKKEKTILGILVVVAVLLAVVAVFIYVKIAKIAREQHDVVRDDTDTVVEATEERTSWIVEKGQKSAVIHGLPNETIEYGEDMPQAIKIPNQMFQNDEELKQSVVPEDIQRLMNAIEKGILVLPADAVFVDCDFFSKDITYLSEGEVFVLLYEEDYRNVY